MTDMNRTDDTARIEEKNSLRLQPLIREINRISEESAENVIIAVDGRCASGKTTLSAMLSGKIDCNVFHMDDFFLRPEQRSPERLKTPGENIDHERFLEEILRPLKEDRQVIFRRYDCHQGRLLEPVAVPKKHLNIIEGVYSLHPLLLDHYDLTVFSDIDEAEQKDRIIKRNTPEMAEKFFAVWIPMEEVYFSCFDIRSIADLII